MADGDDSDIVQPAKTILVAEDELEIREFLVMMFDVEGFNVLKASDGREALDLMHQQTQAVDLLVTDLGLPRLGGMELIQQARIRFPLLKVVAISGFGHANVRSGLKAIGVDVFFPKPFYPRDLLATVKEMLGE